MISLNPFTINFHHLILISILLMSFLFNIERKFQRLGNCHVLAWIIQFDEILKRLERSCSILVIFRLAFAFSVNILVKLLTITLDILRFVANIFIIVRTCDFVQVCSTYIVQHVMYNIYHVQ